MTGNTTTPPKKARLLCVAVASLILCYLTGSAAIERGSLWFYILVILFLALAIKRLYQAIILTFKKS